MDKIADWKRVAAYLLDDENGSIAEMIERKNHCDIEACRLEMIQHYLEHGDVSWKRVVSSLRKAGYTNIARKC